MVLSKLYDKQLIKLYYFYLFIYNDLQYIFTKVCTKQYETNIKQNIIVYVCFPSYDKRQAKYCLVVMLFQ